MNRFKYLSITLLTVACASTHQADAMLRRAATCLWHQHSLVETIHSKSILPVLVLPAMRMRHFSTSYDKNDQNLKKLYNQLTPSKQNTINQHTTEELFRNEFNKLTPEQKKTFLDENPPTEKKPDSEFETMNKLMKTTNFFLKTLHVSVLFDLGKNISELFK